MEQCLELHSDWTHSLHQEEGTVGLNSDPVVIITLAGTLTTPLKH